MTSKIAIKKSILFVLTVAVALLMAGCRNGQHTNVKIVGLRSAGRELPNPNIDLFHSYDYISLFRNLNIHWCISDANNNWKTLEYWKKNDGTDSLYVFDEEARSKSAFLGNHNIAYEYMSMENYYYNPVPSSTFYMDYWQREFGGVFRAHNMMHHYSLIMDEEEALQCLQYGNFGIEVPGQVTDWSCVYNAKQRTILFNVRDEMDKAFIIDLKKDL